MRRLSNIYNERLVKAAGGSDMTFLKSLDSPPFIATYRWAGSFDGRYMPQAYSLLLELNQKHLSAGG
uniref:Uncharacterized protein n=1 Tax=Klebsiella pneumoniae TaxID=573 RepID=A0A8B0SVI0_KLEPN|nr:hypothetical protein [Klebsiella pneumoniae]